MFQYKNSVLCCENIPLADIAAEHGTPVYVYSAKVIRSRIEIIKDALAALPDYTISYAVKVNNNLGILKLLVEEGIGADIISRGELLRYLTAGGDHSRVMFAGVAKSTEEIACAIDHKIAMFNVESIPELIRLGETAKSKNTVVNAAIRINPDVETGTLEKITTGKSGTKFGVSIATLKANTDTVKNLSHVKLIGTDMHIGSQILGVEPFIRAFKVMAKAVEDLRAAGFDITTVDIGGGIGVPYDKTKNGFDFDRYKNEAVPVLKSMNAKIIIEPGRFLVAESGALVMNVEYIKEEWGRNFIVVNGGMNDYIRVAMYEAYNEIFPAVKREGSVTADIVGPVCETSDIFAKDRVLTPIKQGDIIALMDTGGYGMSMASNYNARPFIAEVMVDGGNARLIRRRQPLEDLIQYEKDLL